MATIDEIKQQAAAVKNATQVGENTAERVGGALAGLANIAEQQGSNLIYLSGDLSKKANTSDVQASLEELKKEIGERTVVEGNVTNLPDEEDITSGINESGTDVLSLKDRVYNPLSFSGKGYKILRKNIKPVSLAVTKIIVGSIPTVDGAIGFTINGVEVSVDMATTTMTSTDLVAQKIAEKLTATMTMYEVSKDASTITLTRKFGGSVTPSVFSASTTGIVCTVTDSTKKELRNIITPIMMNQPNTIYEIRYDFDLNGETIQMNEGCTLKFEGGSLNNGILKCDNTIINNANFVVLNNCSFSGTILSEYVRPEWFGAIGNGIVDDSNAIISSINSGCDVLLTDNSTYGFSTFENVFNLNGQKLYSKKKATFRYLNNWIDYNNPNTAYKWIFRFIGNSFEINNIRFDLGKEEWVSRVEVSNEVYMNARKHSLANVTIRKSSNFKVCNCDFIGGIHSLDILNECSYFNVDSCTFSKNTADSLYVTDGSHNGIIQNCHLSDNGDDGYCVNVQDAQYIVGHNITVINCTGSNCQGSLCIASGGRDVSFINVNGDCLRAAPVRIEYVNSDVYGANLGRVTFSGCSIKCKEHGFFSTTTTSDSKYIIPVNVVIENCYFYSDTPLTQMFYKGNNYIISNCLLENISLHIYYSNDITFSNNTIIAPNNITCENSKEIKFLSNKFYNSGKLVDKIKEQRQVDDLLVRRNVNIKNSTVRFIGNQYTFNGELSENQKYFHITLDDYCSEIDFCQIDTDIFQTRNNSLLHISKEGIIDFSKCEVYNLLNINNGQLISDKLTHVISIKVDKELLNLFPWNKKYLRAASANERPKEFDIPSNYSNAIYCDNSNQCYYIYNSIKKIWNKLDTSKPLYTEGNERCAGWGNSRPTKLTNKENDKGYQYFDFNLLKPIWWNGASWIDSFGNPANAKKQGTTEERPTNVQIGYIYKDTSLGKLILWNGTAWVNMDGTQITDV
nr:MAG TPA: outer surface protein [Caudoviricetes sp.]